MISSTTPDIMPAKILGTLNKYIESLAPEKQEQLTIDLNNAFRNDLPNSKNDTYITSSNPKEPGSGSQGSDLNWLIQTPQAQGLDEEHDEYYSWESAKARHIAGEKIDILPNKLETISPKELTTKGLEYSAYGDKYKIPAENLVFVQHTADKDSGMIAIYEIAEPGQVVNDHKSGKRTEPIGYYNPKTEAVVITVENYSPRFGRRDEYIVKN